VQKPHDNALQVVKRPAGRYFARDIVQIQRSLPDTPIDALTVGPYQTGDPCGASLRPGVQVNFCSFSRFAHSILVKVLYVEQCQNCADSVLIVC
jgi:hypothetical protein